jgi:protein involved in polysaccharide export with SLBB domain
MLKANTTRTNNQQTCGQIWLRASAFLLITLFVFLSALGRGIAAEEYRLGPDDVISVTVLEHPELSAGDIVVTSAGRVRIPVAGDIPVSGKTLNQVDTLITQKLKATLRYPEVTVSLRQTRPRRVFITGAVAKPGVYDMKPGWRISEAIAVAGGLVGRSDLMDGMLNRVAGKSIPLRVQTLQADSNNASNLVLMPDDVLRFVERTVQVNVVGQVWKTGSYSLPVGSGVLEALAAAGGVTPKASLRRVAVNRTDGSQPFIDLYKAVVLGEKGQDIILQNGDLITIPESKERVTVLGSVDKPGFFDIPEGRDFRLREAIMLAGGPTARAALGQTYLKRADGSALLIDLYSLLTLGLGKDNVKLLDGDVLNIPEARGITVLGAVRTPGTYYIEGGRSPRVTDILALAGGALLKPEDARINISRAVSAGSSASLSTSSAADKNEGDASLASKSATESSVAAAVEPITVSLQDLRNVAQNELVFDGDLITVSAPFIQTIYISGEVEKPGAYELKETDSLPELIVRAGGPTPLAALTKVTIKERGGSSKVVDIASAIRLGDDQKTVTLNEGDFVVIPRNEARVFVTQAVNRPGYYPIPENGVLTIGEALSLAGGPKDKAKLKQVAIFHQGPNGVERRVLSLEDVYNGQLALNLPLQNGEVVYVPEGKPSSWETITKSLGPLGILGTLFR